MTRADTALDVLCRALRDDPCGEGDPVTQLDSDGWLDVLALANVHRLGPALCASLARTCRRGNLPDDVRAYLDLLYRANRDRNVVIRRQAIEFVAAMNRAGIQPLLLKGVLCLVAERYRDPAERIMVDIDFAVTPEARPTAECVLHDLGYRIGEHYPDGHHAVAEFRRAGDPAAVDLHIELIDQSYVLPAAAMLARSRPMTSGGASFRTPDTVDRLLHALLHAQIHHLGQYFLGRISLAQLDDFCRLATRLDIGAHAWSLIDGRLGDHALTLVLDSYLVAANRLFAFAWPLDRPPLKGAGRQFRRWQQQLRMPALTALSVPVGNLSSAFAWHRMRALYGDDGSVLAWRLRHAQQYVQRHSPSDLAARLFRGLRV